MKLLVELMVCLLMWAGLFFIFVGALGLIRLPDIYTRMHATSKCDTLGVGLVLLSLMTQVGGYVEIVKLILIGAFIWTINPLVTHAIGSTAYHRGEYQVPETFFWDCYEKPCPGEEMLREDDLGA